MLSQLRAIKALGWRSTLRAGKLKRLSNETIRGYYTTRAIIALFNVGFFDEIKEQQTVNLDAFATERGLDPGILGILCDYLFSLRILRRAGEQYALGAKGRLIVDASSGVFYHIYAYEDVFDHLEALLRQEKAYGTDITRRPEFVAKSSGQMGRLLAFPVVTDLLTRNGYERILDLACGDATFLIDLCQNQDHLEGYGIDIAPEGIALGQRRAEQYNLQDRIHLFVEDLFNIDKIADQFREVDVATCIYVLHEFLSISKEQTLDFLGKFKSSFAGIPLIVCEVVRHTPEELRAKPGGLIEIQLTHDLSKQSLFSRKDWQALFREAGFADVRENYLDFARTVVYTVS